LTIVIRVIPLCTVDRKRPGSEASFKATTAPALPLLAIAFNRASRAETTASSPIASTPFTATSARIRIRSSHGIGRRVWLIVAR